MEHDLKIWPQYFARVEDGSKTFEVRKNDRGFQAGDAVLLREWNPDKTSMTSYGAAPGAYTGKALQFRIGYVLPIDAERVVFSLLPEKERPE